MNVFDKITVTDIKQMFTVMSPHGRTATITGRRYYGLSFCIDGKITYEINGKKVVSDTNHAVILPKGKSYSLCGDKTGRFPVINFDCTNFICGEIMSFPIQNAAAYIKDYEKMKNGVMEEVKRMFKPEFINRIDEIMVFRPLNKEEMKEIVTLLSANLAKRCKEQMDITLNLTVAAKQYIVDTYSDAKMGARPLKRAIQRYIEDPVSEQIITERMFGGKRISGKLKVGLSKTDPGKLEVHFTDHVDKGSV